MPTPTCHVTLSPQRGLTLIVVLVLLTIVTIVGIGGARIALLGERSTRFDRDYQIAWQSAEQALMDAELDINGPATAGAVRTGSFTVDNDGLFVDGCGTGSALGLCRPATIGTVPVWWSLDFATSAVAVPFGRFTGREGAVPFGNGIQPALAPRYIIETLPYTAPGTSASIDSPRQLIYRVTAVGFGPNKDVQVKLQTSFKKQ